ncbi:MAG: hypothetical protein B6U94_06020 [Thermofilum sp. ex4484_79]|nr:MAG: hypothetical protein B6U94_06020 [Thermofilum sp. ex4484_79]
MKNNILYDLLGVTLLLSLSLVMLKGLIFSSKMFIAGSLPLNPVRDFYRGWFSWDYLYNLGNPRRGFGPEALKNLFFYPFYIMFGLEGFVKLIVCFSIFFSPIIMFLGLRHVLKYDVYSSILSAIIFGFNGLIHIAVGNLEIESLLSYVFFSASIFLFMKSVLSENILYMTLSFMLAGIGSCMLILEGWIFFLSSFIFLMFSYLFSERKEKKVLLYYLLHIPIIFLTNPFMFSISPLMPSSVKTYQLILLTENILYADELTIGIYLLLPIVSLLGLFEGTLEMRTKLFSLFLWFLGIFLLYYFPVRTAISSLIAFSYALLAPFGMKKFYSMASYLEKVVIEVEDEETGSVSKYIFNLIGNIRGLEVNFLGLSLLSILCVLTISPIASNIIQGPIFRNTVQVEKLHLPRTLCNGSFCDNRLLLIGRNENSSIYKEFGIVCSNPLILFPSPKLARNMKISDFLECTFNSSAVEALEAIKILGVNYAIMETGVRYPFTALLDPVYEDKSLKVYHINGSMPRIYSYRKSVMAYGDYSVFPSLLMLGIKLSDAPIIFLDNITTLRDFKDVGLYVFSGNRLSSIILESTNILNRSYVVPDKNVKTYLLAHGANIEKTILLHENDSINWSIDLAGDYYELWVKIVFWKDGGLLQFRVDNSSYVIDSYSYNYRIEWVRIGDLYLDSGAHNFSLKSIRKNAIISGFSIISKKSSENMLDLIRKRINGNFVMLVDFERMRGSGFYEKKHDNSSSGYVAHCKGGYVCSFATEFEVPIDGEYNVYLRLSTVPRKSSLVRITLDKYFLSLRHNVSSTYKLYWYHLGRFKFKNGTHYFELETKVLEYNISKDYDVLLVTPLNLSSFSHIFRNNTVHVNWVALSPLEYIVEPSFEGHTYIIFSENFDNDWNLDGYKHFNAYGIINGYYGEAHKATLKYFGEKFGMYQVIILCGYLYIIILFIIFSIRYWKKMRRSNLSI